MASLGESLVGIYGRELGRRARTRTGHPARDRQQVKRQKRARRKNR